MQFHEYMTLQSRFVKNERKPEIKQTLRKMKPAEARLLFANQARGAYENARTSAERNAAFARLTQQMGEQTWVELQRPFYNVWPIAIELSQQVKLELAFAAFKVPFESIVLRFARGHEPNGLASAMLFWNDRSIQVTAIPLEGADTVCFNAVYNVEDHVESWITRLQEESRGDEKMGALLIRLVVFVGLLSHDDDLITPIVLSKDQKRYAETDDPDVKKWLEERAARRAGRGFDVGRTLQLEKEKSPHWRNPHLCLFWTGAGRINPVIKMRSGAVIQRVSMAEVPTGYLGPEADEDDEPNGDKTRRESISKSRRFAILKRDGYKCQLCGRSQDNGVKLHIDHRMPHAQGGSNEDGNLWTLCEDCNLGKSDERL
jgi:hypothetical protein